jgi:hypothetical protein
VFLESQREVIDDQVVFLGDQADSVALSEEFLSVIVNDFADFFGFVLHSGERRHHQVNRDQVVGFAET